METEKRYAIIDDMVQEVQVCKWSDNGKYVRLYEPYGRMMLEGFNVFTSKPEAQQALQIKLQDDRDHVNRRWYRLMNEIEQDDSRDDSSKV